MRESVNERVDVNGVSVLRKCEREYNNREREFAV